MLTLYDIIFCGMIFIPEALLVTVLPRGQVVSPRSGLVVDHLWATVFFSLFCRTSRRQHKNNIMKKGHKVFNTRYTYTRHTCNY